jgi:hypothetical protein
MKNPCIKICFYLVPLLLSSCALTSVNLAKRYRNTNNVHLFNKAPDPLSFAQVDLNCFNIQTTPAPDVKYNVLNLSREGQAQYIKALDAKFPDAQKFMKALNTNFAFIKKDDPSVKIIPKTLKKSFVFTVDRLQYQKKPNSTVFNLLGDRINYLELAVTLNESGARFNSWDRFVTDHLTLNLGKVSSAQTWTASANLAAQLNSQTTLSASNTKVGQDSTLSSVIVTPGADGISSNTNGTTNATSNTGVTGNGTTAGGTFGGSAGLSYTDSYNTSQDLTTRILKLEGDMKEKKIILRQEGGPGIDLSGNVVVSLTYEITADWAPPVKFLKFDDLYHDSGKYIPIDSVKYKFLTVIFPDIKDDITGDLDYQFLYRQVNHGNRNIPEARQKVTYQYGTVNCNENTVIDKKPVVLIKKDDIRPKAYILLKNGVPLSFNGDQPYFENIESAGNFYHYLNDLITPIRTSLKITVNGALLNFADLNKITIKTINL